ncbi:hypothetical protein MQK74_00115 [Vibrio cholerae]|nr:hypothetical protein [Vibrio cholerae]
MVCGGFDIALLTP